MRRLAVLAGRLLHRRGLTWVLAGLAGRLRLGLLVALELLQLGLDLLDFLSDLIQQLLLLRRLLAGRSRLLGFVLHLPELVLGRVNRLRVLRRLCFHPLILQRLLGVLGGLANLLSGRLGMLLTLRTGRL